MYLDPIPTSDTTALLCTKMHPLNNYHHAEFLGGSDLEFAAKVEKTWPKLVPATKTHGLG